ncbi:hypothetical protein M438DRAFT_153755 [Aureobasidium pullulans EXF-150]|uniref:Uncharacterized protein n=1 Tax=Aureobasidium pullulans EXF-150 TaxID=1043002 RepID=A0A074XAD5_AURPU|nr:uncharacterized protein M438DRAFT_153755 [Aureobasidium pullulans EXF-150]KEQ79022.1 hypothetical protein M438DRAFT_153755 [Aureobasidium pullulans EXF-150]
MMAGCSIEEMKKGRKREGYKTRKGTERLCIGKKPRTALSQTVIANANVRTLCVASLYGPWQPEPHRLRDWCQIMKMTVTTLSSVRSIPRGIHPYLAEDPLSADSPPAIHSLDLYRAERQERHASATYPQCCCRDIARLPHEQPWIYYGCSRYLGICSLFPRDHSEHNSPHGSPEAFRQNFQRPMHSRSRPRIRWQEGTCLEDSRCELFLQEAAARWSIRESRKCV